MEVVVEGKRLGFGKEMGVVVKGKKLLFVEDGGKMGGVEEKRLPFVSKVKAEGGEGPVGPTVEEKRL